MTNPKLKISHESAARMWHFQPRVVLFPCFTNDCVSHVLSYGQLQESWVISGLQWQNVNEYRLLFKNAHSPNYCSWLAVCVNFSANFYCKIALINRFRLYLIKIYSKTPKNKQQTERKQKHRRIYLTFAFSERHVTSPGVALYTRRTECGLRVSCPWHTGELCKNGWTDRDAILGKIRAGKRYLVLDGVPYLLTKTAIFEGNMCRTIVKFMNHAKGMCAAMRSFAKLLWTPGS